MNPQQPYQQVPPYGTSSTSGGCNCGEAVTHTRTDSPTRWNSFRSE